VPQADLALLLERALQKVHSLARALQRSVQLVDLNQEGVALLLHAIQLQRHGLVQL